MRAPAPAAALTLACVASLALVSGLAGCATVRSDAGVSNFELAPERVGWNVSDEARFTLSIKGGLLGDAPAYVVDRDFAIEEVFLHERGWAPNANHRTKDPASVGLKLLKDGSEVAEAPLGPGNESLTIAITLPDSLADSEYALEIELFQVGRVKSAPFRVNVP